MTAYLVSILTEGAIFGIMALVLDVPWAWSGDFDVASYGYIAVGASLTLVLTIGPASATPPAQYILGLQLPYPLAVVIAVLTAMAVSLVVGSIALRHLRGIYFSIVTLGAVYVMYVIAGQFVPLFNGYNRLSGLFDPMGEVLGLHHKCYQSSVVGLSLS